MKINPVKLVLGIMVVFYDIGFIIQHYVLYPTSREKLDIAEKYAKLGISSQSIVMNQALFAIEERNQREEEYKVPNGERPK